MRFSFRYGGKSRPTLATRIGSAVFFTIFLLFGVGFMTVLLTDLIATLRTWSWQEVPCTILTSGTETGDGERPYVFRVTYRYTFEGQSYESDRHRRDTYESGDYSDVQRLIDRYPGDSQATCRVNPEDPTQAVLETEGLWHLPFLLIPLIFVCIGAGGLYFTFRGETARPVSHINRSRHLGQRGQMIFFSLFLLVGLIMAGIFGSWVYDAVAARNWPTVPCVVLSSAVRSHTSDDGTTYSIDILYQYEIDGREYRSNRYSVFGGSSSGYAGKQAVVDQLPPGAETVCYVNPNDPAYAILYRGWSWAYLLVLFPLPFIAVGAGGLIAMRRRTTRAETPPPQVSNASTARSSLPRTPARLKPQMSPKGKLGFLLLFATIWNGIVSVFVVMAINSWRKGDPDYFLSCFMIPFVVIGLGTIAGVIHCLLALFNPKLTVTIDRQAIPLGESAKLQWEFGGRIDRIERLRITLEGTERARYETRSNGKRSTSTTSKRFAEYVVFETQNPPQIERGTATLEIPADTMHSFDGGDNKIIWTLAVRGEIARWPDVVQEYEIDVLPMPLPQEVIHD